MVNGEHCTRNEHRKWYFQIYFVARFILSLSSLSSPFFFHAKRFKCFVIWLLEFCFPLGSLCLLYTLELVNQLACVNNVWIDDHKPMREVSSLVVISVRSCNGCDDDLYYIFGAQS